MKKILNSKIFLVLITMVITAVTTVSVTTAAQIKADAEEITYTPTNINFNVSSAKNALDSIYRSLNNRIAINSFGTPVYKDMVGSANSNIKSVFNNVSSGKYLLVQTDNESYVVTTAGSTVNDGGSIYSNNSRVVCTTGTCAVAQISGMHNYSGASSAYKGYYVHGRTVSQLFVVDVETNGTTITVNNEIQENVTGASENLIAVLIPIISE